MHIWIKMMLRALEVNKDLKKIMLRHPLDMFYTVRLHLVEWTLIQHGRVETRVDVNSNILFCYRWRSSRRSSYCSRACMSATGSGSSRPSSRGTVLAIGWRVIVVAVIILLKVSGALPVSWAAIVAALLAVIVISLIAPLLK